MGRREPLRELDLPLARPRCPPAPDTFEPIALAGFVLAFGTSLAILWELGEYLTFIWTNEDEFATAYTDTLGDLTFDFVGALIAAAITYELARRRDASAPTASASAYGA